VTILEQQSTTVPTKGWHEPFLCLSRQAALLLSQLLLTDLNYLHKARQASVLTVKSDSCNFFSFSKNMTILSEMSLIFHSNSVLSCLKKM